MRAVKGRYVLLRIIKGLWIQETCKHTHVFHHAMPQEHWLSRQENGIYKNMGKHGQLQIRGCYICGKVWAYDWGA